MPYVLVFTEQYNRRAARFLRRHPELRSPYLKTLQLLEANPAHPWLRMHPLRGKYEGLHSVSINLSYRITLELLIQVDKSSRSMSATTMPSTDCSGGRRAYRRCGPGA